MPKPSLKTLIQKTNALRQSWSVLGSVNVDPSQIFERSAVFEREMMDKGRRLPVYVKVYTYKKSTLQRLWRRGRSQNEARNLVFFNEIGIPAARVIAWAERRNKIGRIVEEYIITEAIADAVPLEAFMHEHCPNRETPLFRERRDWILRELGKSTRSIHDHGFLHRDLKWRNILGRIHNGQVELFWIDCPIGDFSKLPKQLERGRLKDCATLDKLARKLCSTEERKHFVAHYLSAAIDSPAVEDLSNEINAFRRMRFDAKDRQQALEKERRRAEQN
ncbi:MAG TPA: hypothetical protein DCX06_13570 [Opitutae bacterium]|nr:hypothetical protein [Opitutae bacterium]